MGQAVRVGGEVDTMCMRCRMVLAHTVLAMVGTKPIRVQCNTCGGQHNFRAPTTSAPRSSSAGAGVGRTPGRAPEEKPEKVRISFDEQLAMKAGSGTTYSPKTSFLVDEVVVHPIFGRGFVKAVRGDKVDIVFKAGEKTLVHGRG
jgi:hypothetical protein